MLRSLEPRKNWVAVWMAPSVRAMVMPRITHRKNAMGVWRVWAGDRKKRILKKAESTRRMGGKGRKGEGGVGIIHSRWADREREGEPGVRCSHKRVLGRLPWMGNIGRSSMGGAFTPLFFPISPENMLLSLQPTPLYLCSLGQVWYKLFLLISNESHNTHRVVRSCVVFCRC